MNVTSFYTVDYENKPNWKLGENKANTKPIKPNTNPISIPKTSFHPQNKMNDFADAGKTNPIKPKNPNFS
ncbi:hypothetical protein ES703_87873 [subsurface metagenome]